MLSRTTFFLGAMLFALVLVFPFTAQAMPGATIISRGVANAYGELPEVDGFADISLQERINSHFKTAANDLQAVVKGKKDVNYSYTVIKNTTEFLSVILKADVNGVFVASTSINLDAKTANPYSLKELFVSNESFFDRLEENLGWRPTENSSFGLAPDGIVFVRQTDGIEQTVPFGDLLEWVDIGKAGYYLDSYYVGEGADGKLLRVKKGNLVILRLESNKSTGYAWQMANTDYQPVLRYINSAYLLSSALVGSSGWDLMVFGVETAGESVLQMEYKRPWQNQVIKKVSIQIVGED